MSSLLPELDYFQAKNPSQALDAALATVRTYCGWAIAPPVTETVTLWSPDGNAVFVPTLNLTAVTSITQDGVAIDPTTVTFERYGVVRRTPGKYFSLLSRVSLAIVHGYAALPGEVKNVVLSLAQRSVSDSRGIVPSPTGARMGGAFVENYGPRLTDADKERLAPYTLSTGSA